MFKIYFFYALKSFLPRELNRTSASCVESKTSFSLCWRKVHKKQINKLTLKADLALLRKLSNGTFE
jgi:hypothetical protein